MTYRPTRAALMLGCATLAMPALADDSAEAESGASGAGAGAAAAATAADSPALDRIVVEGDVLYSDLVNALKSPTPIIDVPQSLSIVTDEEIERRGFTSIAQIADYTPGVTMSQGEGHRDAIIIRGLRSTADFFIDGVRDDVQYYRALYNLEQVEILRGPNALLFGRGGTGGIVNRVTKKGVFGETFGSAQVAVDTFGEFGIYADFNLPAGENAAFRLNAMYEGLNNHRDFYDGERIGINPTLRARLGADTVIDLAYEYIDHERFIDRGIPTGADGRPVEAFEDIVFGDRQENYTTLKAHTFRALVQHDFSDSLKLNAQAFYGDYDKVYSNFYASGYDAVNTPDRVTLDGYIDEVERQNLILSANLVGAFETGALAHTMLGGVEYIDTSSDQFRFNPVWNTSQDDTEIFAVQRPLALRGGAGTNASGQPALAAFSDLNDDTRVNVEVVSAYVQDEIAVAEWLNLVLGARFDRFDITVDNAVTGAVRTRRDEEISPRLGVIVKPRANVSLYASYSESFLPRSGEQFDDLGPTEAALDPDRFSNLEAGLKWDFAERLALTAAVFEIEQSSPQPADDDPETLEVIDSRIRGFEIALNGALTDFWSVSAGYSYLDGEQVGRTGPTGLRPRELPEHMVSLWNDFTIGERLGLGLGLTHQGSSFADNGNNALLPAYTRIDAAAWYDVTDNVRVQVNVENLTDELYFPNAHAVHQVTVAPPLNARFAVTARF